MGTNTESVPEGAARATTLSAVATMAVIALVAVTVVVVWARVSRSSAGSEENESAVEEPVPDSLVGGIPLSDVPGAVTAKFDLPVVGAAEVEELPPDVTPACTDVFGEITWDEGEPTLQSAMATPDALYAVLEGSAEPGPNMGDAGGLGGDQPDRFRVTCTARMQDGAWVSESNGFQPVFGDDEGFEPEMGGGYSCCDENGLATATGSVQVPEGAAWGLQDRSGWYLAYPVTDRTSVTVSWKFREQRFGPGGPPQSTVTFVDDEGTVIGEAFAGGMGF